MAAVRESLSADDRLEIQETIALHAHIFDAHRLDRLEELFTPDAVYDMSRSGIGTFAGIDVIRGAAAQMIDSGHFPLQHSVTNIVISSAADDVVIALSKGLMVMADGAIQGVNHEDTLRRHDGRWRISRRIITPVQAAPAAEPGAPR